MSYRAPALTCALALALVGCPKDPAPSEDALILKLQAEKERLARGGQVPTGARPAPTPDPLAMRAAVPDSFKPLVLVGTPELSVGSARLRVSSVETSHSVPGPRLSLTSNDYFVRVSLSAQVSGGGAIDLTQAALSSGGTEYPLAKDAQRLAGTRELARALRADEKLEVVLYFEAPQTAIGPGLKLSFGGGDGVALQ